jgi:hypothetical protein
MARVLEQYERHHPKVPDRVVVYKSSRFAPAEIEAIRSALARVTYTDLLSIDRSDIRFLRCGEEPPIRGTAIEIDARRYVVYTRGYVPFLKLYPGMRIPRPLEVFHAHGDAPLWDLLEELMSLTRLNWNSADFACAEPITLAFARRVGLILGELPESVTPAKCYRFYI